MFGIGGFELVIILIFAFIIFGPDKLPEIAKTVGKGIARFREAQQEMNDTLGGEKIFDPNNPDEPFKNPVEVLDKIAQKQDEKKVAKTAKTAQVEKATQTTKTAQTAQAAEKTESFTEPAGQKADGVAAEEAPRQESFTERKARYERERAARKAAEAEAAAEAKVKAKVESEAEKVEPESASAPTASEGGEV